jgi:molybdopterin-guanine dinucleotide biosynthesis protein A
MSLAGSAIKTIQNALAPECVTLIAGNAAQFEINAFLTDTAVVFDLVEGRGPLGGIHAALSYARTPWIFVLACDYPFVSPELLKLLGGFVSDDFGAVAPEQPDGRLQPLCAFYRTEITRPVVDKIINQPRVPPPLRETLRELSPRIVKFDEYSHLPDADNLFININTADDLEKSLLRQNRQ